MKTAKSLAHLGSVFALSFLSAQLSAKPLPGEPGSDGPERAGCCDIADNVYRLTNPITADDRFEVVLDLDIPRIQVMVHDKTLDRYYILDHRPHRHRGHQKRHLNNDDTSLDGAVFKEEFEIAEMRGGKHHKNRGCHKRPGHRPPHPHPPFAGKGKPPCRGTDLHLNLSENKATPLEISVSMDLKHSNNQLTGTMSIKNKNGVHIKDASVTFAPQAK